MMRPPPWVRPSGFFGRVAVWLNFACSDSPLIYFVMRLSSSSIVLNTCTPFP